MTRARSVPFISVLLFVSPSAWSNVCDVATSRARPVGLVYVGMWKALWNGFDYQAAAYRELGEQLGDLYPNDGAGSYVVPFMYSVSLFGIRGVNNVTLCIFREEGETWEEALEEVHQDRESQSNTNGSTSGADLSGRSGSVDLGIDTSGFSAGGTIVTAGSFSMDSGSSGGWRCHETADGVSCRLQREPDLTPNNPF